MHPEAQSLPVLATPQYLNNFNEIQEISESDCEPLGGVAPEADG